MQINSLWLVLQSDKGISSVRLAEAIGVSQPTAWRMGHALRLLMTREHQLDGTVEMDEFYIGGGPRRDADRPHLGRGRKGQPRTTKTRFSPPSFNGQRRLTKVPLPATRGPVWWPTCRRARLVGC